ncbi:MAG: Rpp14/Pop5 family protein [Promethearchaeota archaeon]
MRLERQRYILFEYLILEEERAINEREIMSAFWSSIVRLFGESIAYKVGLWLVRFDPIEKWGIIRCTNLTKEAIIASLAYITHINQTPIIIHTIKTSGTIKKTLKIKEEYFFKNRNNLERLET